jgi:hypothetical protein
MAVALPYRGNSGWSAPSPVRWGKSVLSIALSPLRPAQGSTMAPLGRLVCLLILLSVFDVFPAFVHWEFSSLPHPHSWGRFSVPLHSPLLALDYNWLFMLFIFVGGVFNLPKGYTGLCSRGVGKGVSCGMCCSPVGSAGLCRHLWSLPAGRNGVQLFSCRHFLGQGSAWWGIGFQNVTEFNSCSALSCAYWKKKKKREIAQAFFPGQTHPVACVAPGFSNC